MTDYILTLLAKRTSLGTGTRITYIARSSGRMYDGEGCSTVGDWRCNLIS